MIYLKTAKAYLILAKSTKQGHYLTKAKEQLSLYKQWLEDNHKWHETTATYETIRRVA
jgi:hypothetical protein